MDDPAQLLDLDSKGRTMNQLDIGPIRPPNPSMMERLNRFLVAEVAAVAAYRLVLVRYPIEAGTLIIPGLHIHEQIMESVAEWIENLGGSEAAIGDGSSAFSGLEQLPSDKAGFVLAITLMRAGERRHAQDAGKDLHLLDEYTRTFVVHHVAPELARCLHALG